MLCAMFIFLVLTLQFKNVALGAFTIIFALMLATFSYPNVGGVMYSTGSNISLVTIDNTTSVIQNEVTSSFSSVPLGTTFLLVALFMSFHMYKFMDAEKKRKDSGEDDE
jgi:membrane-bound ClpP family serine protease